MSDAITTAQAPDTFDVLSFVEHTAYPTSEVKVYTDAKGATELTRLANERKAKELLTKEATTELDGEIAALEAAITKSALTFKLQGLPPGMVRDLYNVPDDADNKTVLEAENDLIAHTIIGVVNSEGVRDARVWDADGVGKLRHFLKEGEFGKLINGVVEVNFNASVFDQATDAGFLGGSSDLAS